MIGRRLTKYEETWIQLYSGLILLIAFVLRCMSPWSKRLREFFIGRELDKTTLEQWRQQSRNGKDTALFFCSSAGEFEQAKPLIDRLINAGRHNIHVILFSQSGIRYLVARGEVLSYSKAPIDTITNWRAILRALQPTVCFVVKYELWPGFLLAAKETTRLILVDGVVSDRIQRKTLSRLARSFFLRFFERAFVVALSDKEFFCRELGMDSSRVNVTGDTKYDRVRERALVSDAQAVDLRDKIDRIFGPSKRLIVGSGWHKDIDLVLTVYRSLIQESLFNEWQLVIAPHLVDKVMISWIIEKCSERDLSYCLYSQLDSFKENRSIRPIIILDKMGALAEFYACGQAAFVGGGLHHQVHNVLEPAIRGLYLAFGPRYQNSAEARLLVDEALVQVIDGETQLYNWWRNLIETRVSVHNALLKRVQALCGSADAIIQLLNLTDR